MNLDWRGEEQLFLHRVWALNRAHLIPLSKIIFQDEDSLSKGLRCLLTFKGIVIPLQVDLVPTLSVSADETPSPLRFRPQHLDDCVVSVDLLQEGDFT